MRSDEQSIRRKLLDSPVGRAVTEAGFAVIFTFLPIALLSIPFAARGGEISWAAFTAKFYKFWEAGQMTLPILAVCGTIAALAALNGRGLPQALNTFAWIVSLALLLACGVALGQSNGFTEALNTGILQAGILAYVIGIATWIVVSVKSETGVDRKNPEERANRLVEELRGDEGRAK